MNGGVEVRDNSPSIRTLSKLPGDGDRRKKGQGETGDQRGRR